MAVTARLVESLMLGSQEASGQSKKCVLFDYKVGETIRVVLESFGRCDLLAERL